MSTLVTGGSGFLGRHVVTHLAEQGSAPLLLGRAPSCAVAVDLGAGAPIPPLPNADLLVHLAWDVGPGYEESPVNEAWVRASVELVRAFAAGGGRRVVVAGTSAEYGPDGTGTCGEDRTPIAPWSAYGRAKAELHDALRAGAEAWGIELAWCRLFQLYGPGERPGRLVPALLAAAARGEVTEVSDRIRDFIDVRDAGRAVATVARSAVRGAVNVGTGVGTSVADVARRLAELRGRPELVRVGPRPHDGAPDVVVADVGRLGREVGFTTSIDVARGLGEADVWWRHAAVGR